MLVVVAANFGIKVLTLVELCGDTTARSHPLALKWLTSMSVVRLTPLTGPKDSVQSKIFLPLRPSGKAETSLCPLRGGSAFAMMWTRPGLLKYKTLEGPVKCKVPFQLHCRNCTFQVNQGTIECKHWFRHERQEYRIEREEVMPPLT